MGFYNIVHYYVAPIFFFITTPILVQYLGNVGQDKSFSFQDTLFDIIGNLLSWASTLAVLLWAFIWLKIPSRKTYGPATYYKEKPEYQDNGFIYYVITTSVFLISQLVWPKFSSKIFWNMPPFVGTLNISAFVFCIFLFIKGLKSPEHPTQVDGLPKLFLFYRGVELHPCLFGVQVKQLTNCRFGLILWQLLVLAFYITGYQNYGFNMGSFVNFFLQTVYLAKFFWWESGYFWTLDIVLDSAGYYICWGCMVFVPMFYTYSSYYLVLHQPVVSDAIAIIMLILGLLSILMNYRVDYEKQSFQKNRMNDDFKLWFKEVKYIEAEYTDNDGAVHRSRLLASGCWGVARHLNYFFELLLTISWSFPGFGLGIHTFLYAIFLSVLLIHRCFRDESRCRAKYGEAYDKYCKMVPHRIIPYVF